MKRVLMILLCATFLVSCATPHASDYANSPNVISSNAEYMARMGIVPPEVPPPVMPRTPSPAQPGISGWDVLGAAILFPLLLPVAMIETYPSYRYGVHCRSFTYKDEAHVQCY